MTVGTPQPVAPPPVTPLAPTEDRQWASFAHFGGILGILPSLVIFLIFKDRGAITRQESKEALNWQITFAIVVLVFQAVSALITGIAIATGAYALVGLGGWIVFLLYIANVIFSIIGGITVNRGGSYRYPLAIRLVT